MVCLRQHHEISPLFSDGYAMDKGPIEGVQNHLHTLNSQPAVDGQVANITAFRSEGRRFESSRRLSTSLGNALLPVTSFLKLMYIVVSLVKDKRGILEDQLCARNNFSCNVNTRFILENIINIVFIIHRLSSGGL